VSARPGRSGGGWRSRAVFATGVWATHTSENDGVSTAATATPEAQAIQTALIGGVIGGICVIVVVICFLLMIHRRLVASKKASYSPSDGPPPTEMTDLQGHFMNVTFVNPDMEDLATPLTNAWMEAVHESHE
jgi:hypothetical protein